MKYQFLSVDNCKIFYREAGNPENPTILLLHGFPSASHMFRDLMPELRKQYESAFALETIKEQYCFGAPEGAGYIKEFLR